MFSHVPSWFSLAFSAQDPWVKTFRTFLIMVIVCLLIPSLKSFSCEFVSCEDTAQVRQKKRSLSEKKTLCGKSNGARSTRGGGWGKLTVKKENTHTLAEGARGYSQLGVMKCNTQLGRKTQLGRAFASLRANDAVRNQNCVLFSIEMHTRCAKIFRREY